MTEEAVQTEPEASSFMQRLAETGRAKLPIVGDVLVFDKSFWSNPSIWKVPFVDGYIPTWNVVSIPLLAGCFVTTAGIAATDVANKTIQLFHKLGSASTAELSQGILSEPRITIAVLFSGIFTGFTFMQILTALKHIGISKEIIQRGRLRQNELEELAQADPDIESSEEGSALKILFSGECLWHFQQAVLNREKTVKK